jgi:glycosyltransferase involved in cell wall biosynthesis
VFDIERSFANASPCLTVIANALGSPPLEIAEACVARGWPFAILTNFTHSDSWPSDDVASRLRKVLPLARKCFFVGEANRILAEKQIGQQLDNAEIVRDPIVVDTDSPIPWPHGQADEELRMACIGRLSGEEGQDILFDILATPRWMERKWRLTLYGNGPARDVLGRLVKKMNLQDRVFFGARIAAEEIWREDHVLIAPPRHQGLPTAITEAMFCGRPVVATEVGTNPEVVEEGVTGFLAEASAAPCIDRAMERMWARRGELRGIGYQAAASIRELTPKDVVETFAERILGLVRTGPNDLPL